MSKERYLAGKEAAGDEILATAESFAFKAVSYVLEFLASVMSEEDVLRDFPELRMGQIQVVMRHSSKGEKKSS